MKFSALIIAALPALARAGEIGLGPGPDIVISWTPPDASGNLTFTTTCFPRENEGDIAWCAWGIAPTPSMNPANVRRASRFRARALFSAHPTLLAARSRRSSGSR
jgi:hypothetical protein